MPKQYIVKIIWNYGMTKHTYYISADQQFVSSGSSQTTDLNHALLFKSKAEAQKVVDRFGGEIIPADGVDLKANQAYVQLLLDNREQQNRQAEAYQKKLKDEQQAWDRAREDEDQRLLNLKCPCCGLKNKSLITIRQRTSSRDLVVGGPIRPSQPPLDEYWLCQECGIHFTDVKKKNLGERPGGPKESDLTFKYVDWSE